MQEYDIIIIGGGAAGLMAAGHSAKTDTKVLLLEKMTRPGRKLSITGKGRCNITNTAPVDEFIQKIKPNGRFMRSAFSEFFSDELIAFFNRIGVKTEVERGGRVFPESGRAAEVVNALTDWCRKRGVIIKTGCRVKNFLTENGTVKGVTCSLPGNGKNEEVMFKAEKVILATGGVSYPATGSTGDGYTLAKSVGHTVNFPWPSLVPLETEKAKQMKLNGLELRNIKGTVWINGKKAAEDFGEMSFTDTGISGPIVLSLSRIIVQALKEDKDIVFSIDLKPALDEQKLNNRLLRDFSEKGKETFRNILNGMLPKLLIPVCIEETKIDKDKSGHQVTSAERKELRKWLKNFNLKITGHRPINEAIITAGGVETNEVNQKTMESKLVKGLFFAGEILDLDAPTGGYNLQIAFSTGWMAAKK